MTALYVAQWAFKYAKDVHCRIDKFSMLKWVSKTIYKLGTTYAGTYVDTFISW